MRLSATESSAAGRYYGRFAEYDLSNEMIHGNYYEERLGQDITRRMAYWVKEVDPKAVLPHCNRGTQSHTRDRRD